MNHSHIPLFLLTAAVTTLAAAGCRSGGSPAAGGATDPATSAPAASTPAPATTVQPTATAEPTATPTGPELGCGEGDACPEDRCRKVMVPCADLTQGCRTKSRFVRCVPKGLIGPPAMICSRDKATGEICVSGEGQAIPDAESCGSAEMERFAKIQAPCP